jgi:hypothetical protein
VRLKGNGESCEEKGEEISAGGRERRNEKKLEEQIGNLSL